MFELTQSYTNFSLPSWLVSWFNVELLLSVLAWGTGVVIVITLSYLLLRWYFSRQLNTQPQTLFEVKPLRVTQQNPYTTEQLFNLIHSLANQVSKLYRFFRLTKSYALEIVSTKDEGIRYLIRVHAEDAEVFKKSLLSYLPGLTVTEVDDYLPTDLKQQPHRLTEFKLTSHFAFPLKKQESLEKHDPIAYITGSMTKLKVNELMAFQLVISPQNKGQLTDVKRISKLIYARQDLVKGINSQQSKYPVLVFIRQLIFIALQVLLLPLGILIFIATDGKEGLFLTWHDTNHKKTTNPYQQELEKLIKAKLDQPLFKTSVRLLVVSPSKQRLVSRQKGFISALSSFSNSSYQALVTTLKTKFKFIHQLKHHLFTHRCLTPFSRLILSSSEISDLYHFPFTKTTKTEDLIKSHSKELPAPTSLKKAQDLDIIFAQNHYGGSITPIGLTQEERRRHMYVLGATGTGKTTLLLSMIKQDLENNKGLCLIDPHGDLTEEVLELIPEKRLKDVIYFNPDDISYPLGINLLELTPGLDKEAAIREKEFLAESIISLFHKVYTEKYSGPRMEYILRNTIHTAFTVPNATLFTVYKLLINTPFRKSVVRNLTDPNLRDFWKYEFAKAGDYQKVKMISPITNKIGRFLFSPSAKRILEQEKSTINFEEIMNQGKILLCDVAKGKIGEDNSEVFGVVMMTKIQLAALKRARMKQAERKDFYLYVDEFQNFATPAFAQILSEARKYRLSAILAHQTTSQLEDPSLVNVTLANTGTVVCFRTANPEDERLILPQFQPYIEKGEIASLPSFHFYMRLGALNPEEPFSGQTILTPIRANENKVAKIIQHSREKYAVKYVEKEDDLGMDLGRRKKVKAKKTRFVNNFLP